MKDIKIKENWDLKLFYKSDSDSEIEKDIEKLEAIYINFKNKYENKNEYLESVDALFTALSDYEEMLNKAGAWKPLLYFYYKRDLDSTNKNTQKKFNLIANRLTKASNHILFFNISIGKIARENQDLFLRSSKLSYFKYFLSKTFETAKHDLSVDQEKIMALKSLPASSMWVDANEKLLNSQVVEWKGKKLPINEALSLTNELPQKERFILHNKIVSLFKSISFMSEAEINALYTNKKIDDELRSFPEPYSSTIIAHETDKNTVLNLVKTTTNLFTISHKFYALKAKILKQKTLHYSDRSAPIGKINKKISFKNCVEEVSEAFAKFNPEYSKILERFLANGQIDVYPKKGKAGGAYCSSSYNMPTLVLLNHTDSYRNLMTLAHEMGHAIHSEYSKKNFGPIYCDYSTAVAEVASTLFERFVFDSMIDKLTEEEKIIALHDYIQDSISTTFRQIACFNFELELHNKIRSEGYVTKDDMAKMMNKHMASYLGPKVKLNEEDGYYFVTWGHLRSHFYVYSYAYGSIISRAIYERVKREPAYLKEVEQFLSAGGSDTPENIFRSIEIDTKDPKFFIDGLKSIEKDIKLLEKLLAHN